MSDNLKEELYQRILRECHPLITRHCSPDQLVGALSAHHLLTSDEIYALKNQLLPPLNRLNELVGWLPRKGGNWMERFAAALSDIAGDALPGGDSHVIVLNKIWKLAKEGGFPLSSNLLLTQHQEFGNHHNSSFDACGVSSGDCSLGNHGDSLHIVEPVEEINNPYEEHMTDNRSKLPPSLIALDKTAALLCRALGINWKRIYNYCNGGGQFEVAMARIKEQYPTNPHMQVLMTLKLWTRTQKCSSLELCNLIKPLLGDSPQQVELTSLLLLEDGPFQGAAPVTVANPQQHLNLQQIDEISRQLLQAHLLPSELCRVAMYCNIGDDTMATLEHQHSRAPVVLLSAILSYWMEQHHRVNRLDLATILNNMGIKPDTVM